MGFMGYIYIYIYILFLFTPLGIYNLLLVTFYIPMSGSDLHYVFHFLTHMSSLIYVHVINHIFIMINVFLFAVFG